MHKKVYSQEGEDICMHIHIYVCVCVYIYIYVADSQCCTAETNTPL